MSGNTKVLRKCLQLTVISCLEGQQNFLDRQESSLINKKIYIIFLYIYILHLHNSEHVGGKIKYLENGLR